MGTIQFVVDGVPDEARFINYEQQWIWDVPPLTESVLYNFRLGVTGSITAATQSGALALPGV